MCVLRALLEELRSRPDALSPRALRSEIEADLTATNDHVARHGSFAEMAREHYAETPRPRDAIAESARGVIRFFYFALACQTVMQVILLHFFATHMR